MPTCLRNDRVWIVGDQVGWIYIWVHVWIHVRVHVWVYIWVHVRVHVWVRIWVHVWIHIWVHVGIHILIHVLIGPSLVRVELSQLGVLGEQPVDDVPGLVLVWRASSGRFRSEEERPQQNNEQAGHESEAAVHPDRLQRLTLVCR